MYSVSDKVRFCHCCQTCNVTDHGGIGFFLSAENTFAVVVLASPRCRLARTRIKLGNLIHGHGQGRGVEPYHDGQATRQIDSEKAAIAKSPPTVLRMFVSKLLAALMGYTGAGILCPFAPGSLIARERREQGHVAGPYGRCDRVVIYNVSYCVCPFRIWQF